MNKKYKKILVIVAAFLILTITTIASYAYFTASVAGNSKETVITSGQMALLLTDGQQINLENALPGSSVTKTFKVKNTGTVETTYNVYLSEIINEFEDKNDLVYVLSSTNGCANNIETVVPSVVGEQSKIISSCSINPNQEHEYSLTITFKEDNTNQDDNKGKKFSAKIALEKYETNDTINIEYAYNDKYFNEASSFYDSVDSLYQNTSKSFFGHTRYKSASLDLVDAYAGEFYDGIFNDLSECNSNLDDQYKECKQLDSVYVLSYYFGFEHNTIEECENSINDEDYFIGKNATCVLRTDNNYYDALVDFKIYFNEEACTSSIKGPSEFCNIRTNKYSRLYYEFPRVSNSFNVLYSKMYSKEVCEQFFLQEYNESVTCSIARHFDEPQHFEDTNILELSELCNYVDGKSVCLDRQAKFTYPEDYEQNSEKYLDYVPLEALNLKNRLESNSDYECSYDHDSSSLLCYESNGTYFKYDNSEIRNGYYYDLYYSYYSVSGPYDDEQTCLSNLDSEGICDVDNGKYYVYHTADMIRSYDECVRTFSSYDSYKCGFDGRSLNGDYCFIPNYGTNGLSNYHVDGDVYCYKRSQQDPLQ